jgi:hypothetical protein
MGGPSGVARSEEAIETPSREWGLSLTSEEGVYEESWLTMRHAILLLGTMRLHRDSSPTA